MSRKQSIRERDDLFQTLMNDPEFADAVEAINSLCEDKKPKTQRAKKTNTDRSFRSRAVIPEERRQSLRLKNKAPQYTKDDLIDDSVVKMTEKERNRARFSEEYLERISQRQKEFWKNYWAKKREQKAAEQANNDRDAELTRKQKKKKTCKGYSKEYLQQLSERRTQYWKEYWRIRREEKAKMEAENKSWKAE